MPFPPTQAGVRRMPGQSPDVLLVGITSDASVEV
jgi:hypothetical protein